MKELKIGRFSFTETDVEIIGSYMNKCVNAVDDEFKGNTKVLKLDFMLALRKIEQDIIEKFSAEEQAKIENYKIMLGTKHPVPFVCILASIFATAIVVTGTVGVPFSIMLIMNAILAGMYMFTILEIRDFINLRKIIKMVETNAINRED